jgi:hypothetical protein
MAYGCAVTDSIYMTIMSCAKKVITGQSTVLLRRNAMRRDSRSDGTPPDHTHYRYLNQWQAAQTAIEEDSEGGACLVARPLDGHRRA